MNVVGNVLGYPGISGVYEESSDDGNCDRAHMFMLGSGVGTSGCSWGSNPAADPAVATIFRHGNFDHVSSAVSWSAASNVRTLPASLYLGSKPAFFAADQPWPWVGPDLSPMAGELPAKVRFDRLP